MTNLDKLVKDTKNNFAWYESLFDKADCENIKISDLPLITDEILVDNYYHNDNNKLIDYYEYHTSGTSSKKRKRVLYSKNDQLIYLNQRQAIIQNFCGIGHKKAAADLGTGHAAATASEIFSRMGCQVTSIDFTRPIEEHLEILNGFEPDVLFTMPVILDNLLHTGRLAIAPKKIIILGDVATQEWQKYIASHFNISQNDILDVFGSIEIGSIAFYNHKLGRYQFDPYIVPECIHPSKLYVDTNYDGRGEILLLTSFAREYFPAIRFVTNDLIVGFEEIEIEGQSIYTFQRCLGRFSTEYKHGEKINLYDINEAVVKYAPNLRYDVNDNNGVLTIRIGGDIDDEQIKMINRHIRNQNPDIDNMILSGLVPDIMIHTVDQSHISNNSCKRFYSKNGG